MAYRLSKYNIYIENKEEILVLNGMTGESSVIPAKFFKKYPDAKHSFEKTEIHNYIDNKSFAELMRKGILTGASIENEVKSFARIIDNLHKKQFENELGYFIILTYNCNFRCVYCYQGEFNKSVKNKTFTRENIDLVLKALPELEKNRRKSNRPRGFSIMGGEPLIKENHDMLEYFINSASNAGPSAFSAISNGYDLNHYKDLLGNEKISSIQITLDGPPEVHNKLRVKKNGRDTFEKIEENISMALGKCVKINLRVNVFKNNISKIHLLADRIIKNKWNENKYFSAYLGQIHGKLPSIPESDMLTSLEIAAYLEDNKENYPSLSVFIQPELLQIRRMYDYVKKGQSLYGNIKTTYCGAHINSIVIDPDRNLSTCMETDTSDRYLIGKIRDNGTVDLIKENLANWHNRKVSSIPECLECPYSVYCGGGCVVRALENYGQFNRGYCNEFDKLFKKLFLEELSVSKIRLSTSKNIMGCGEGY